MDKKSKFLGIIFITFTAGLVFILGFNRNNFDSEMNELYQVYLNGEIIGVLNNKTELYDLINEEQEDLKKEFNVEEIHPPEGLELVKIQTYDGVVNSASEIYSKIQDLENFTIEGYTVTINTDTEKTEIYILNEEDLETSIDDTIKAFVTEEQLEQYRNNTQAEIEDEGEIIDEIYIQEEITIKNTYIPTDELILTDSNELSRYLLFGTLETQSTYYVMPGDTIKEIAESNSLSVSEFLIANPDLLSEYTLLFPGQEVNIGLIDPQISIVVETTMASMQEISYDTEVKYDEKLSVGSEYTEQEGSTGITKSTFKIETINGVKTNAVNVSSEEIKPAVDAIIVKGGLSIDYEGNAEYWGWPTEQPYVITSSYGYRWGSLHNGTDISGTGYNSDIYSIQSGVIVQKGYNDTMGNYYYIDHQNGYYSVYMHLASVSSSLKVGDAVIKGQYLGGMGSTGYSTGTHLHISIWIDGYPYSTNASTIDPMTLYPDYMSD